MLIKNVIIASFLWSFNLSAQWTPKEFVIGVYWPPPLNTLDFNTRDINQVDLENFERVKNCYFNLVIDGMQFLPKTNTKNQFASKDYYLALAKKAGLKVFFTDSYISTFGSPDASDFDKNRLTSYYKAVPSFNDDVYGIYLGDEPKTAADFTIIKKWGSFFREKYPRKPTFINLLARYAFKTDTAFEKYLQQFSLYNKEISIVAFDHYPFRQTSSEELFFLTSYFYNLNLMKLFFKERTIWATVHTVKNDGNIMNPTEAQLRFMAFCPIAYGMKGLSYWPYHVYKTVPELDSSIDADSNKYNQIKLINNYIRNIVGPVVMKYENEATLHRNNTDLNTQYPFKKNELLHNYEGIVKDVNSEDILLGIFAKKNVEKEKRSSIYLWLVNKNTISALDHVTLVLNGNYENKVKIAESRIDYKGNEKDNYTKPTKVFYNKKTKMTTVIIRKFNPGEGIMCKIW